MLALTAGNLVAPNLTLATQLAESMFDPDIELMKKKQAHHIMLFASPYDSAFGRVIPHMHIEFKQFIQTMSQGRIYVDIQDQGSLGVGTDLMAAVTRGKVDGALISVSNMSRALPVLDILNIPFWASSNQQLLNLVSSPYWQKKVLDNIENQGELTVLFHYIVGARTLTSTKKYNRFIKLPSNLNNVNLRVPASKVLTHFYQMTPANVVDVPWAKVAGLAENGQIHALDPSIIGLNAGPNQLNQHIGKIALLNSVPDAWVNVLNQRWLKQLPRDLRLIVKEAAKETFKVHLQKLDEITANAAVSLQQQGAYITELNRDEQALWLDQFGHHNPQWHEVKRQLLGSVSEFEKLVEATHFPSQYQFS